jgi:hypothetical protein
LFTSQCVAVVLTSSVGSFTNIHFMFLQVLTYKLGENSLRLRRLEDGQVVYRQSRNHAYLDSIQVEKMRDRILARAWTYFSHKGILSSQASHGSNLHDSTASLNNSPTFLMYSVSGASAWRRPPAGVKVLPARLLTLPACVQMTRVSSC